MLTLELPEPPTLNEMLRLARRMTRRGPGGRWMREPQSLYWVRQQEYELAVRGALLGALAAGGQRLPTEPWPAWRVVAVEFRVHSVRDWCELHAGLKWAVDALVQAGLVANDSPRELAPLPEPTQRVARRARGVRLVVAPGWPATYRPPTAERAA